MTAAPDLLLLLLQSPDATDRAAGLEIMRLRRIVGELTAELWVWAGVETERVRREAPPGAKQHPSAPIDPPRAFQLYVVSRLL